MEIFPRREAFEAPLSIFFPSEMGMETPARKRKRGKMRS